jgi:hypothetical protein
MPSKPIELAVARRIVEDMRAYLERKKQIRPDEIAARPLRALSSIMPASFALPT